MPPLTPLPLPIIPRPLLRRHHCFVASDTRFRSAARLLQAQWRDGAGLRAGTIPSRPSGHRRLGSMLAQADAEAGGNFLTPDLARLARHEVAYRQPGALVHVQRLLRNTLTSQALAINAFGPAKLNSTLARSLFRLLLPGADIAEIHGVHFEYSAGRDQAELTNDRSAFDVAATYRRSDGATGFIGIEVKYSEIAASDPLPAPLALARLSDIAEAAGLYTTPATTVLSKPDLHQLCREHLLAQAGLIRGDWAEAYFILVAPRDNHLIVEAARRYAAHLSPMLPGTVPFSFITLEQLIGAIHEVGERKHAAALHRRYTDFSVVDRLVSADIAARPAVSIHQVATTRAAIIPP